MYSEYLDSKTTGNESWKKFSNDKKNCHIIGIKKKYANKTPQINKKGTKKKDGNIILFSFLYKAGDIKSIICKIKNGKDTKKDAKSEIFRFEIKTSGNAVNIILLLSMSTNKSNNGFERILPTIEAL